MKEDKVLVSVIIPVYKVEKYLRASIDSVLNQTYKNLEIILVDDGSPDNCPAICDEYEKKYSNVSVIHKQNGGLSDARNCGINASSGSYIYFLDSDDTIVNDAIETTLKLARESNADIVIPDRYYKVFENNDKEELCFHFDQTGYLENPIRFASDIIIEKGRAWRAHSVLYAADLIKKNKCNFPAGHIAEDIVFNLQIMLYAKKIVFCKKAIERYLKREGSITSSFNSGLFETALYIDDVVRDFFEKAQVDKKEAEYKRNSFFSRLTIIYLLSLFARNGLNAEEKRTIYYETINNERVKAVMAADVSKPYFKEKYKSILFVIIHDLLSKKRYKTAAYFMRAINTLR